VKLPPKIVRTNRMYKIRTDFHRNLLYVFLNSSEETNIPEFVTKIEHICYKLIPGFACILVLPKDPSLLNKDRNFICNTGNLIYAYGADKIVGVIDKKNISDSSNVVRLDFAAGVKFKNAYSIKEAERILCC
jgi:hypothetical protein